jgi:hypothetical protein
MINNEQGSMIKEQGMMDINKDQMISVQWTMNKEW